MNKHLIINALYSSFVALPLLLAGVPSQLAVAQEMATTPAAQTQSDKVPEKDLNKPDEAAISVVVTASRGIAQDTLDVPQQIDTVTRAEIDEKNYKDVYEAIRNIPGIGLGPAESTPSYWQEGFTIRGLGAQRVLTLTDGIRQAGQGIGYGGGNLSLYDTFGIERIEVLKGPGSVLYGTDSFGGVINVITRNPKERTQFGFDSSTRYSFDSGSDMNQYGSMLDFGNENAAVVMGGSYTSAGMPNLPDHIDPMSGSFRNLSLWGKADVKFSSDTKLRLIGNSSRAMDVNILKTESNFPIATFPPPGASIPVPSSLNFNIPDYQRVMSGAEITSENLSEGWEYLKSGVYWQQISRTMEKTTPYYPQFSPGFAGPPLFYDPHATVNSAHIRTDDQTDTYEWQNQARYAFSSENMLTFGLDVGYDSTRLPENETDRVIAVAGVGPINGPSTVQNRVRADADQTRAGLYLQDNFKLLNLEFVPGIRFDSFDVADDLRDENKHENGLSGSLGVVYRPSDIQSFYTNLASGFRAPDLGERFQDGIVNLGAPTRLIGDPDLNPERAYTIELGTKHNQQNFTYELASFFTRVQDYIGTKALGLVDGFATDQYANLGLVSLYGVEAAFSYKPAPEYNLYANASRTWTNASEKVDVFNWAFNYGVEYTKEMGSEYLKQIKTGFDLRTVSNWVDNTETASTAFFSTPQNPGFTVVNYRLNFALPRTSFGKGTLVSGLMNIFDTKYYEPFFDLPQPGRHVYVGVQFDF